MKDVESYNTTEDSAMKTMLDGQALTQEIGGESLVGELQDTKSGAGIKDKSDLEDLLGSIKGASVFMNKTPKGQI